MSNWDLQGHTSSGGPQWFWLQDAKRTFGHSSLGWQQVTIRTPPLIEGFHGPVEIDRRRPSSVGMQFAEIRDVKLLITGTALRLRIFQPLSRECLNALNHAEKRFSIRRPSAQVINRTRSHGKLLAHSFE